MQIVQNDTIPDTNALKSREINIRLDLAAAYAKLDNVEQVIVNLSKVLSLEYSDLIYSYIKNDPVFAKVRQTKSFRSFLAKNKYMKRLSENSSLYTKYQPNITNAEKAAAISLFWSNVRTFFVYFDQVPNLDWDDEYLKYLNSALQTKSTYEFYKLLQNMASILKDGHTNVYPPVELYEKFYATVPLETRMVEGKVLITAVFDKSLMDTIKVGYEIVRINNQPVEEYANKFIAPYVSSSTEQDYNIRVYHYSLLKGDIDKTIVLEAIDFDGNHKTLKVERKYSSVVSNKEAVLFEMKDDIAYIKINSFHNVDTIDSSLKKNEHNIKTSKALIIDLRDNGGGTTNYELLRFLAGNSFETTATKTRLTSGIKLANSSSLFSWHEFKSSTISPNSNYSYSKPVVVLIGNKTFSAAEDVVAMFKQMNRGLLVGDITAGSTGQPYQFELPGGGSARLVIKRDAFADGKEFVGYGVKPDVYVPLTEEDVKKGRDPVLKKALEILNNSFQ
ncbi:MAG TPA: S41 family peptidase [Kangiella sp.]